MIRKNLELLQAHRQVKTVFSPAQFVSFRSKKNLKSYLVRSKIYPYERKIGSKKCKGKPCLVCLNVFKTDVFRKINHQLNCNDKYVTYLLSCKVCSLQHVGSTTDKFNLRWNYKEHNQKTKRREGTYAATSL